MTTATMPDPTLPATTAGTTVGQFVDALSGEQKLALLEQLLGRAGTADERLIPLTSRDGRALGMFVPRSMYVPWPAAGLPERDQRALDNRRDAQDVHEMIAELTAPGRE
jgi:hypothetical protein